MDTARMVRRACSQQYQAYRLSMYLKSILLGARNRLLSSAEAFCAALASSSFCSLSRMHHAVIGISLITSVQLQAANRLAG
jgi:hypothetical protein